jgi:hypothetical protein
LAREIHVEKMPEILKTHAGLERARHSDLSQYEIVIDCQEAMVVDREVLIEVVDGQESTSMLRDPDEEETDHITDCLRFSSTFAMRSKVQAASRESKHLVN